MSRPLTLVLAAALACALALPATAALPPYYDRLEQLQTILGSDAVAEALGQRPIDSIEYEDMGKDGAHEWEVEAGDCKIDIWLDAQPLAEGTVGKTSYQLRSPITACK